MRGPAALSGLTAVLLAGCGRQGGAPRVRIYVAIPVGLRGLGGAIASLNNRAAGAPGASGNHFTEARRLCRV